MLRDCMIDFKGNWNDYIPLIEVIYENSFHSSIQMTPYYDHYGKRCRSPIRWFEVIESWFIGQDVVDQAMYKVKIIHERFKTA